MGLNAVVFLNKNNLAEALQDPSFPTDPQTGEIYPTSGDRKYSEEVFTAVNKRLGNASFIGQVANEISTTVSHDSILMTKVLRSSSHSGDVIALNEIARLESEINLVREKTADVRSADLQEFLNSLLVLIEAAKEQKNPIVFV